MRLQQIFEKIRPQLGSGSRVFGGFVAGSMALNLGPAARQRLQKWFRGADFQASQKWETELGLNGGFQQHGWHGSENCNFETEKVRTGLLGSQILTDIWIKDQASIGTEGTAAASMFPHWASSSRTCKCRSPSRQAKIRDPKAAFDSANRFEPDFPKLHPNTFPLSKMPQKPGSVDPFVVTSPIPQKPGSVDPFVVTSPIYLSI